MSGSFYANQVPAPPSIPNVSENPKYFVPEISRTLGARAWKQVIKDWDERDLTRAHQVLLSAAYVNIREVLILVKEVFTGLYT